MVLSRHYRDLYAARRLLSLCAVLLTAMLFGSAGIAAPGAQPPPLVLGVHPYLGHNQLQQRFGPLARYLSLHLGRAVIVRVGRDYEEHIREIGANKLDIAYLGPASYVRMTDLFGRKPLLARLERQGRTVLGGHIIVSAASRITQLEHLRGKHFAFGDPDSTMSTTVPRAVLQQAGLSLDDLGSYSHFKGHTNVALAVLSGQQDAGAVKTEVFREFRSQGLRSLALLPTVSEHLFVARSDTPAATTDRLRRLLLGMRTDPAGRSALQGVHGDATGLAPVADSDYDSLREMLRLIEAQETDSHGED